MSAFTRLKSFDVYRKLPQDLTEATMSGAIGSLFLKKSSSLTFLLNSEYCKHSHYAHFVHH